MNTEHIVNDIKEIKQHIIVMEDMLEELRIFYITNKGKYGYDYKLAKTFFNKLQNFIEKEILNFDKLFCEYVKDICNHLHNSGNCKFIGALMCSKIEDALIHKILIKEKKLEYYENIMELYSDKSDIENKQYSMSLQLPTVIFLITLFMCFAINDKDCTVSKFDTSVCFGDCVVSNENSGYISTQIIDTYNKVKDLIINIVNYIAIKNFNYKYV